MKASTRRSPPRFLPILTEVVDPSQLVQTPAAVTPAQAEVAHEVMPLTGGAPEGSLSEETQALIRRLVEEQLQCFRAQMLEEFDVMFRQKLTEAVGPY